MGRGRSTERAKDFKGTIVRLLGYVGRHKVAVVLACVFAVCSVVFNIVGPRVLGSVTTKLYEGLVATVQGTGSVDFEWIGMTLLGLLGLYLASSACNLVQGWLMTGVTQKICYRMRKEIAEKIAVIPMSYFNGHSKGDVLSRITNDVDTLGQSLNQSITQLITSVTQVVGVLVMMLSISLPLTGVTVLALPVSVVIVLVMVHFSQKYFREQQRVLGTVNGIVEEDFAGQNVIQVFDRSERAVADFEVENDRLFVSGWRSQFLSGLMMPLMSLVGNMGYVGVVVVGAQLALVGQAAPGDIQSFIQYVRNFTQPIQQLANVSNTMQSMAAATERVFEFLAAPEESEPERPQLPARREGRVEFDHVRFGYVPGKTIIKDFSCVAEPGQTVAIVGPTGAGKTTLIKLLQRFWDVDAGSLRVDGIDVRDWDRSELRQEFAMVLQDTWLFNGTIRENIRYGRPDATDEEVEAAARAARCDHFIHTLAGGYDFVINEEGTNLSQGQRQLVTIARAVLADRPALILDEATSNVDTRTEELIQRAMDALMVGRTSFVIAHRLST
ncbi:MAG TPA: ABC transporter ATP-binding protein/permease, partial [Candidatus Olsenella avistercoris]|nr:ABC transporter ATP-binding protein/permease [Candidatus Olsenella avistercoris]